MLSETATVTNGAHSVVENVDIITSMMNKICTISNTSTGFLGAVTISGTSVTISGTTSAEYIAPGSKFIKQKLYPTHAKKGRKLQQKMHTILPSDKSSRAKYLLQAPVSDKNNIWESDSDNGSYDNSDIELCIYIYIYIHIYILYIYFWKFNGDPIQFYSFFKNYFLKLLIIFFFLSLFNSSSDSGFRF